MARSDEVTPEYIEHFISRTLIRKAIPFLDTTHSILVRCSPNAPGEVFRHESRCYYNPRTDKIPLQRGNYQFQQVFYGAVPTNSQTVDAQMTALLETTLEHVKNKRVKRLYVTVSRWKFQRPLKVFILPFSKRSQKANSDFRRIARGFEDILRQNTQGNKLYYNYLKEFLAFISDTFCKRRNKKMYYKISSAYYNAIMKYAEFNHINIDGLIYPSANTKAEGMNIVLKKEIIDNRVIYCDMVIMQALQRSPSNAKYIFYEIVSNGANVDNSGRFSFDYIA